MKAEVAVFAKKQAKDHSLPPIQFSQESRKILIKKNTNQQDEIVGSDASRASLCLRQDARSIK
jgi:hypothetical protein